VDFVAVVPSWIWLGVVHGNMARPMVPIQALKLLRFFRVIKSGNRFVPSAKLFYRAIILSVEPLLVMGVILCLSFFVFGVIFFDLESGKFIVNEDYPTGAFVRVSHDRYTPSPVESTFDSLPTAIYYSGVMITSLGYGT
jgi:hypothetical protein